MNRSMVHVENAIINKVYHLLVRKYKLYQINKIYLLEILQTHWTSLFEEVNCLHFLTTNYLFFYCLDTHFKAIFKFIVTSHLVEWCNGFVFGVSRKWFFYFSVGFTSMVRFTSYTIVFLSYDFSIVWVSCKWISYLWVDSVIDFVCTVDNILE